MAEKSIFEKIKVPDKKLLSFFVAGKPTPKGRPRVMPNGHTFTPEKTRAFEELVSWTAKIAMGGQPPLEGPVFISLAFFGSHANADVDNLAKAVLDAMNGIVYKDDKQISRLTATKRSIEGERGLPGVQVCCEDMS